MKTLLLTVPVVFNTLHILFIVVIIKMSMDYFNWKTEKILFQPFPENSEFSLKLVFDIYYYVLLASPIRITQDDGDGRYCIIQNKALKIFCIGRMVLQWIASIPIAYHGLPSDWAFGFSASTFISSLGQLGAHYLGIIYFYTLVSSKGQSNIAHILNHLKTYSSDNYLYQISQCHTFWKKVQIYLHCVVGISWIPFVFTSFIFQGGILEGSTNGWYFYALGNNLEDIPVNSTNGLSAWKLAIGFIVTVAQMDAMLVSMYTIVLMYIVASTVKSNVYHLLEGLEKYGQYSSLKPTMVLLVTLHLRKSLRCFNESFGILMSYIIVVGALQTCTGFMWLYLDGKNIPVGLQFLTILQVAYFFSFLYQSASAAAKANELSSLLQHCTKFGFRGLSCRNQQQSLQEIITMYEISSGGYGVNALDIFNIKYGFIGGILTGILSNMAMILQSANSIYPKAS